MLEVPLVRFLATHGLIGKAVGWTLGIAAIGLDLFALGTLLRQADALMLGGFMFCFILGTSLGSLQMGLAVNALSEQPGWMPDRVRRALRSLWPRGAALPMAMPAE